MKKILMVCLGNICRSPIAEAVMQKNLSSAGLTPDWEVNSVAIGAWHSGSLPDPRALNVMNSHGIKYQNTARKILPQDFQDYDYILGMDENNMEDLKRLAPRDCRAKLLLLGDFGLKEEDCTIVDPYYLVGEAPFEKVYAQCVIACQAFLKQVLDNKI